MCVIWQNKYYFCTHFRNVFTIEWWILINHLFEDTIFKYYILFIYYILVTIPLTLGRTDLLQRTDLL